MKEIRSKRGQEEIIGFVMIVLLVSIILLILLGIGLRGSNKAIEKESREIQQFLGSMMEYSTRCALGFVPNYLTVKEIIKECNANQGSVCESGEKACDVMSSTIEEIIDASWKIGQDRPIKGYLFNSTFESAAAKSEILSFSKGVCESGFSGSEFLDTQLTGSIVSSLKLCF